MSRVHTGRNYYVGLRSSQSAQPILGPWRTLLLVRPEPTTNTARTAQKGRSGTDRHLLRLALAGTRPLVETTLDLEIARLRIVPSLNNHDGRR